MRDRLKTRGIVAVVVLCVSLVLAPAAMAEFGVASVENRVSNQDGSLALRAGGHPYELSTTVSLHTRIDPHTGLLAPDENAKDILVDLPPGFVGNPTATPTCPVTLVKKQPALGEGCPNDTQVGVVKLTLVDAPDAHYPLFNVKPPAGVVARFGFTIAGEVVVMLDSSVRTGGDYGVSTVSSGISENDDVIATTVTLWGVPADPSHDDQRCSVLVGNEECTGETHDDLSEPHPSDAPAVPLLTNPDTCGAPLAVAAHVDSWGRPGVFSSMEAPYLQSLGGTPLALDGCNLIPFEPSIGVSGGSGVADSPTGLDVDVHLPQTETANSVATSALRKAVVTLPEGIAISPSAADGLAACSPEQIGLEDAVAPSCPDASKVGSAEIDTPLLADPLEGSVYLAQQGNNPFGSLLAVYIVAEGSGVLIKQAGEVTADPVTGQLTFTVGDVPQSSFGDVKLHFFGGPRAALVNPPGCGTYTTSGAFEPWSGGATVGSSSDIAVAAGCQGGQVFAPSFQAGTAGNEAGAFSAFSLTLSRVDGEQRLGALTVKTPPGLLAILKGVERCPEPLAAQGACGDGSLIGHATTGAGAGPDPVFVGGKVFLTGPYQGAPFGLSIVVPAKAGPLDLGTVVVRSRVDVDPRTSQITITSDPLPRILQGIPLDIKTVNVTVDRAAFMFNPTSCAPLSVDGTIASTQGASATVASHFQAANCATLPFHPLFKVSTKAKTSKAGGAYLDVKVTSGAGQANLGKVAVSLPKQLPSRLTTIQQACTEAAFNANPASCPVGSDIGIGTASTPILADPISGPVYLVSHGGAAFPDIVMVLQGEGVTVQITGSIDIKNGITSGAFNTVPDVPVSTFDLNLPQGPHSALGVNIPAKAKGSLCGQSLVMPTTLTGHNGAQVKQNTKIAVTGCPKAKKKPKAKKGARGKQGGKK